MAVEVDEQERDASEAFLVWREAQREADARWNRYFELRRAAALTLKAAKRASARIPDTCTNAPPVSWPVDAERRRR